MLIKKHCLKVLVLLKREYIKRFIVPQLSVKMEPTRFARCINTFKPVLQRSLQDFPGPVQPVCVPVTTQLHPAPEQHYTQPTLPRLGAATLRRSVGKLSLNRR